MGDIEVLEVRNVSKNYGHFTALDNTSWSLPARRTLGLLGPNGAGKSTTLNIIAGLLRPSSGEILLEGEPYQVSRSYQRSLIGFLPEKAPLYDDMSVKAYLRFAAGLRGLPSNQLKASVLRVVDELQLGEVFLKRLGTLSKGFRQRVGIAQAIIHQPSLLILDEPTLGLDPSQVIQFRELICRLKKDHTIILSTHILQEVEQVCDDVVVLKKGKVTFFGPLEKELDSNATKDQISNNKSQRAEALAVRSEEIEPRRKPSGKIDLESFFKDSNKIKSEILENRSSEKGSGSENRDLLTEEASSRSFDEV